LTAN
jgi:hypothetical protein